MKSDKNSVRKPLDIVLYASFGAVVLVGVVGLWIGVYTLVNPPEPDRMILVDEEAFRTFIGEQLWFEGYMHGWDDARLCILEAQMRLDDAGLYYELNDLMMNAEYACFG